KDIIFEIFFSEDQIEWNESIRSNSDIKVHMKIEGNSELEVSDLKWFNKYNEEMSNPVVLNDYFNDVIKAEFEVEGEIYKVQSNPLIISPNIKLQISEIYPNINQGEVEWIELYNYDDNLIDL